MEDKSKKYRNDSEALDKWIAECFMDPQPTSRYKPMLIADNNNTISLEERVIIPHREKEMKKAPVYAKKVVKLDPVSALEETQRFVARLLGLDNTKAMNVSHSGLNRVVTKAGPERKLNPCRHPPDNTRLGHKKQVPVTGDCNSGFKASKRKFNDSAVKDIRDVKKQKTGLGIVHRKPEQQKRMAKPIGKPSVRERFLATGAHNKSNVAHKGFGMPDALAD